jgi:integrase
LPRLTKRLIDAIATPEGGRDVIVWDDELSGFGLRVRASGARTYVAVYRIGDRKRWFTIGSPGAPWTPETARQRAAEVLLEAKSGGDPQAEKVGGRMKTPTVNQLIDAYLVEGPADKPNKRASSWVQDRSSLHHHVRPLIGTRRASELAASDIARLQSDIAAGKTRMQTKTRRRGVARVVGGKATAARTIVIFQAMCAWAVTRGYLAENPAKGVKRYKIEKRERYLSEKELRTLWDAVDLLVARRRIPSSHATIFRLLALTGARKTEITALSWREVDFARGRVVLAAARSKTGAKQISLSDAALAELRTLHEHAVAADASDGRDFVFPALRGGVGSTVDVQSSWEKVRRVAELPGVRMHDLRHTFASIAVADGVSLFLVGKALGHTQVRTTERYAHLSDSPIRKVANQVSERVQASFPIARSNDDAA